MISTIIAFALATIQAPSEQLVTAPLVCIVVRGEWREKVIEETKSSEARLRSFCESKRFRSYVVDEGLAYVDPAACGLLELEQRLDILESLGAKLGETAPYVAFNDLSEDARDAFRSVFSEGDYSNLTRHVQGSNDFNVFASPASVLQVEYDGKPYEVTVPLRMLARDAYRPAATDANGIQSMPDPSESDIPIPEDRSCLFVFSPYEVKASQKAMLMRKITEKIDLDVQKLVFQYEDISSSVERKLSSLLGESMADHIPMGKDGLSVDDLSEDLRRLMSNPMWMRGLPRSAMNDPNFLSKLRIKGVKSALEVGVEVKVSKEQTATSKQTIYMSRGITLPF